MIHRLYSPWQITNDGEREADRHLSLPANLDGEIVYVLHSLRISSRYHRVQMSGECDFVIFSRLGIMVVEVKGGIMGHGDQGFYRFKGDEQTEPVKNPFTQAEENAHAIVDFLRDNRQNSIFVGSFVCFPECVFDCDGLEFNDLWHRGLEVGLLPMVFDSLQEQIADFYQKQYERNAAFQIKWETLDEGTITSYLTTTRLFQSLQTSMLTSAHARHSKKRLLITCNSPTFV